MTSETHLQQMLVTLRTRLLVMCASTSLALEDACIAFREGDTGRASAVIDGDAAINELENEIDEKALSLLARAQPVASDLRFVVSTLRMVGELERIGDEAASIAERTIIMQGLDVTPLMADLSTLMTLVHKIFNDAVTAFREGDRELALAVVREDDTASLMEMRIIQRLMQDRGQNPGAAAGEGPTHSVDPQVAMHVILITRALNRIWRRATNIAENAYFVLQGVSLKHKKVQDE